MDEESIWERERHQIEQIRQLDFEELQVEEVESMHGSDSDDSDPDNIAAAVGHGGGFTFDAGLASLHTYLGEVEDTHHRLSFLEGGASLNVPLFYLEGVVLFPGATLPLRVVDSNFIMAAERTISQIDMSFVIGVIHVYMNPADGRMAFGRVGTTAEIRQYRRLDDGSVNMVTRGKQRFRVKKRWFDVDNIIWAEIQIIKEDFPLRTPRDVFGTLPLSTGTSSKDLRHQKLSTDSPVTPTPITKYKYDDSEEDSDESFQDLSLAEKRLHESAISSRSTYSYNDQSISSDDERDEFELEGRSCARSSDSISGASQSDYEPSTSDALGIRRRIRIQLSELKQGAAGKARRAPVVNHSREVSTAFWPYWVYRKYDSHFLARRAADMWKKIVGAPSMDSLAREPDTLSFHIGSKIPASVSTRQELLEIDGISYRLRREIELLECFDRVRCKNCQTTIARRSDMMVMSSDGPLGAYVNSHGYVHETMTFLKASGLALIGHPVKEYSWFPGYAWTIANCATCESHMGWLFTAAKSKLQPESFWGIRCSQVGDEMR